MPNPDMFHDPGSLEGTSKEREPQNNTRSKDLELSSFPSTKNIKNINGRTLKNNTNLHEPSTSTDALSEKSLQIAGPSSLSRRKKGTKRKQSHLEEDELEEEDTEALGFEPYVVECNGTDKAKYTLEIYMRDVISCLSKRDLARRTDPRAPVIYDAKRCAHAIIPANQKLMLYAKRTALKENQRIGQIKFVLFKFYVDGTALSEGELYETSMSNPDVHWAKAHIRTTQTVQDMQTVENVVDANSSLGTFKVMIWTKLGESYVIEEFKAMPVDDRAFEKRKQRICIADSEEGGTEVRRFEKPIGGLVGKGPPQAILTLHYDDLLGTRNRHLLTKEFSMKRLKLAGVTDSMFKDAYPDPIKVDNEVITIEDDSDNMDEAVILNMIVEDNESKKEKSFLHTSTDVKKEEGEEDKKEIEKVSCNGDNSGSSSTEQLFKGHTSSTIQETNKASVAPSSSRTIVAAGVKDTCDMMKIKLRTRCEQVIKIEVRPSYTTAKIIGQFLERSEFANLCISDCCKDMTQSNLALLIDGDIYPRSHTVRVQQLDIQCGDTIDVGRLDNRN